MTRRTLSGLTAVAATAALALAPASGLANKGGVPHSQTKACPTHKHAGKHNGATKGKKKGAAKGKKCGLI